MGWASGSCVAEEVWEVIKKYIPKSKQKAVAANLIEVFESHDCDTMSETSFWEMAYKPVRDENGDIERWVKR